MEGIEANPHSKIHRDEIRHNNASAPDAKSRGV